MNQSTTFAQVANNLLNVLQGYTKGIRFLLVMFLTLCVSAEVWGAEEMYKETIFDSSNNSDNIGSYSNSWSNTTNGFKVNITNANNNNNQWNYIKIGSKNNAYTGTIITASFIDKKITKVSLNIGAIVTNDVTSIKLYKSTNGSTWVEVGSFPEQTNWQNVVISDAYQSANLYYKIEAICTKATNNGPLQINGVKFYAETAPADSYTVNWYVNGTIKQTQTDVVGTTLTNIPNLEDYECGDKVFVGWTTQSSYEHAINAPNDFITNTTDMTIPVNGEDYYAVFANVETTPGETTTSWVKTDIASISSDNEVVIAMTLSDGKTRAITNNNGTSAPPIAAIITATDFASANGVGDIYIWNIDRSGTNLTFYPKGDTKKWLYCNTTANSGSNNNIRVGTGDRKVFCLDSEGVLKTNDTYTTRYVCLYYQSTGAYYDVRSYTNQNNGVLFKPVFYVKTTTSTSTETITNYTTTCTIETSISLHPNGGSDATITETIAESTYTVPTCSFTRTEYTFSHWDTEADDSGTDYKPGDNINLNGTDVNLYAQWTYSNVVNWFVKGENKTTTFNGQYTEIYIPTGDELNCGTKTFVGWTKSEIDTETDTKPADLFTSSPVPATTKSGDTYYAVYADNQTTTTITYTWDLLESTSQALAVGDELVIAAKDQNYAFGTTQNTTNRIAIAITKNNDNTITFGNDVQVLTLGEGYEEGTFTLSTGAGILQGNRQKNGKNYINRLTTVSSVNINDHTSWHIGFTNNNPYIHNDVSETFKDKGKNITEYPKYYIQYKAALGGNVFEVKRNVTDRDRDPQNISIYRKTRHETSTTTITGYVTNCGCNAPTTPLAFNNGTVQANTELDLSTLIKNTSGNGSTIQYSCTDDTHTDITNTTKFTANALGTYTINALQDTYNGKCGGNATFTVEVTCNTPTISRTNTTALINVPIDMTTVVSSTSPVPLTYTTTDPTVHISGTMVTFTVAGNHTITASQLAGGVYCDNTANLTFTVTDPCASKTKPSVTATEITTTGFKLTWSALNDATAYNVYNNTDGDSEHITATSHTFTDLNPSTEYSWTVEAVYSDGCTASTSSTTTTSTPVVTHTVNWNVAGNNYSTTNNVSHSEQVSSLPTAPDPAAHACDGKVFVGWTTSQHVDGSKPAVLFTDVAGSPAITADITFYAVFADCMAADDMPEDDASGEYTLVTDVNDLQAGDKIIIACYSKSVAAGCLSSTYLSIDNGILFSNGGTTLTPSANTLIFTLGGSAGAWTLANSNEQLLGATEVKKLAWGSGTTTWKISIFGNDATLDNTTSTYGDLQYNAASPRFTTYTSSQTAIQLYKKTGGGGSTPDPEPETPVISWSVNGKVTTGDAPNVTAECGEFIGWTTSAIHNSSITKPDILYATANDCPKNVTTTYYAVFEITTGDGEGTTETYTFREYCDDEENATEYVYGVEDTYDIEFEQGTGNNPPKYYSNGTAMRIYKGNYMTITSTSIITRIELTFDLTNKAFTVDNGIYSEGIWSGNSTSVKFTNNSTEQIRIISVTVTIGGGTTTYVTTCPGNTGGGGDSGSVDSNTEVFNDKLTFDTDAAQTSSRDGWSSLTNAYSYKAGSQSGIRIATGSDAGSITTNALSAVSGTNATLLVEFDAVGWDSDEKTLSVSVTNGTASPTTFSLNNSKGSTAYTANDHYSFTITGASSATKVKWSAARGKRAIIANIVITQEAAAAMPAKRTKATKQPAARITPTARAAQECASYENYTTICCASPITDLKYSAGANSITLYWTTTATSVTATLYSDEACTSAVAGATQSGITTGTCTFTGLEKTTTYYAKLTTPDGCVSVLEVSTERPNVSVAEWAANQINIDVNTNEPIVVVLENEVTSGSQTGTQAEKLFFSKYYEATGNVKLVAVYNGTANDIDLTNYKIKYGKTSWAADYISLKDFGATKGKIASGEEIILYTMNRGDSRDVAILDCVNADYPDGTWTEVTTANNTGKGSLSFAGDKTLALFNGNTMIDIIGGGTTSAPNNTGANTKPAWGDAKGWTCDKGLSIEDGTMIGISTNRCLLVRNNTVTSGDNAVASNTTDFATLCTEWKGAHVPDDDVDDGVSESCENFAFVGTFDYSDYYVQYENLATSEELPTEGRLSDGTYKVTTPDLHDIACTNMRISIKDAGGNTLVTQDLKVPIIIDNNVQTDNQIYFKFTQRDNADTPPTNLDGKNENILSPEVCADCDIVIRDNKTLTHVATGTSEFHDMSVYPGAKFNNSSSEEFYLNSLQMHAKNDEVSYAIINNDGSTIDVGDMVFVKRMDDKYWYQFSLPYDCNISDIRQLNGQSMGKYWVDWGIKEYNGKRRQAEGTAASAGQVSQYWEKVEETATLKAHHGYIIGLFTIEWTNQMKFVYFTPATSNTYHESGNDAKTTTVNSWYTTPPTTDAPRHHGWNFTGSPYITMFGQSNSGQGMNNTILMTGQPSTEEFDGEYQGEDVYVTIPTPPDGLYYSQSVASGINIKPFTAYFVQTKDVQGNTDETSTLTYTKTGRALPASAPARAAATKQRVLVELLVTAPDGQIDNTGVWVDECYTTDYEIAADLTKMYVKGTKPQLYTLAADNDKMAYNALPDEAASYIPLGLYAPMAGNYTLALNNRVSRIAGAESIELLYNNAVVANLMIQDYTIAAEKGNVDGYSLCIHRRADVNTAIDNITGNTITVIANDGYISLVGIPSDASVYIYDMVGHLMDMQSANGTTMVNMPIMPQGVYNIVVANEHGSTTIKSFIK